MSTSDSDVTGLRCRSCRFILFDNPMIFTTHESEKRVRIKSKQRTFSSDECSHYFLDQDNVLISNLDWLEQQIQTGSPEGPILCKKCSHKLGSFNWKGSQCACGAWQIPSLGIVKSKVDPIKKILLSNNMTAEIL